MVGKHLFDLYVLITYIFERSQNRDLETGTKAETTEKNCLLAYSPWLARPAFLYNPDFLLRGDTAYSGLGTPTSITNQELPTGAILFTMVALSCTVPQVPAVWWTPLTFFFLLFYFSLSGIESLGILYMLINLVLLYIRHRRMFSQTMWCPHWLPGCRIYRKSTVISIPFILQVFSWFLLLSAPAITAGFHREGCSRWELSLSSWGIIILCSQKTYFHFDLSCHFQAKTYILCKVMFVPVFSPSEVSQISKHLTGCWILYLKLFSTFVSHRTQIYCFLIKVIFYI